MAKLIQEQGRAQLNINFGEAKHPQCRGLTVAELSTLDFEKLDISELFVELYAKFNLPNVSKLSQEMSQAWKVRLPNLEKDNTPLLQNLKETSKDVVF